MSNEIFLPLHIVASEADDDDLDELTYSLRQALLACDVVNSAETPRSPNNLPNTKGPGAFALGVVLFATLPSKLSEVVEQVQRWRVRQHDQTIKLSIGDSMLELPRDASQAEIRSLLNLLKEEASVLDKASVWDRATHPKAFHDCLLQAYTASSLERMLRFELDKQFDQIVGPGAFQDRAFDLILLAEREGWIINLVLAAHCANPNNYRLAQFAARFR